MAAREGLGALLAQGVKHASEVVGQGSEQFAMHTKGLEYPAYRPGPVSPAWALFYAITERGGCHRRGWPTQIEKDMLEPFVPDGRAQLVKRQYDQRIPWHCAVTCDIVVMFFGLNHAHAATSISAVTGWDVTEQEMNELCERVAALVRAFNVREGATRADDTLAPRSFQPDPRGRGEGRVLTREMLDAMLDEYYRLREWSEDGIPRRDLLVKLGLGDVADTLEVS
jgi:aldehyde:ferredoxin oxidoreductase